MAINYKESTHLKNWSFQSSDAMAQQFDNNNARFNQQVQHMLAFVNDQHSRGLLPGCQPFVDAATSQVALKQFKNYFSYFKKLDKVNHLYKDIIYRQIRKKCSNLKQCYTACIFFRRFFFKRSPLEFHHSHHVYIAAICIFLAAKVEEKDVNLGEIVDGSFRSEPEFMIDRRQLHQLLTQYEFEVCKTLEYQFLVHSPLPSIKYIFG